MRLTRAFRSFTGLLNWVNASGGYCSKSYP